MLHAFVNNIVFEILDIVNKNDNEINLRNLYSHDAEYIEAQRNFEKTMPKNEAKITKIEKINNNFLNLRFLTQKCLFELMARDTNVKYLFHGTRRTNPEMIYNNPIGFDMRYSNGGMWGKGIYFAVNASYSNNYAHPNDKEKQIFLSEVILGTCTEKTKISVKS